MKEPWRTSLGRVDRQLRTENGRHDDERDAQDERLADLDTQLRANVLVETRREVSAAHASGRDRLRAAVQSTESTTRNSQHLTPNKTRGPIAMMLPHRLLTAAAAIVVAAAVWLVPMTNPQTASAAVFAQMLKQIQGIPFSCEDHEDTGAFKAVTKNYFSGDGSERSEISAMGMTFVQIVRDSKSYSFNSRNKVVTIRDMQRPAEDGFGFLDRLKGYADDKNAESLGVKKVDGVDCQVYRYEWIKDKPETPHSESSIIEIAINVKTNFPQRIAVLEYRRDPASGKPLNERFDAVVTTNFDWDAKLDPKLFDVTIPKGWTVETPNDDASKTSRE